MINSKIFSFDTETDDLYGKFICASIYSEEDGSIFIKDLEELMKYKQLFEDTSRIIIGHNIKYDMHILRNAGIEVKNKLRDTFVSAWLINENDFLDLKSQVKKYFDYDMVKYEDVKKDIKENNQTELVKKYSIEDSIWCYKLYMRHYSILKQMKLFDIYKDVLMVALMYIYYMETNGIKIDVDKITELEKALLLKIKQSKETIFQLTGSDFNINSSKQLAKILYEKLNIPVIKRSELTGEPSTDSEVLEELKDRYNICDKILEYRMYEKLRNTYTIKLKHYVENDGRIRATYRIGGTISGRLSCSEPNLQQIPKSTELGKKIRGCFIPEKGYKFIILDYNNIELRVLAHFSKDRKMVDAFNNNIDIHSLTASIIFGIPYGQIDKYSKERDIAKGINFGLIYGMGYKKLSKKLKISEEEAIDFINKYFYTYTGVYKWRIKVIEYSKQYGGIYTIIGRKRRIPDINSEDKIKLGFAERQSINSIIQGSASDIMLMSMVKCYKTFKNTIKLVNQVHDELIFEVKENLAEYYMPVIKDIMENSHKDFGIKLNVPLVVEAKICDNWGQK